MSKKPIFMKNFNPKYPRDIPEDVWAHEPMQTLADRIITNDGHYGMYSYDAPGDRVWMTIAECLHRRGWTPVEIEWWLCSKESRWAMDGELGELLTYTARLYATSIRDLAPEARELIAATYESAIDPNARGNSPEARERNRQDDAKLAQAAASVGVPPPARPKDDALTDDVMASLSTKAGH